MRKLTDYLLWAAFILGFLFLGRFLLESSFSIQNRRLDLQENELTISRERFRIEIKAKCQELFAITDRDNFKYNSCLKELGVHDSQQEEIKLL